MSGREREFLAVGYRDARGLGHLVGPEDAAMVRFEQGRAVRTIPRYRGQAHTPGRYWCATSQQLLDYESYLECQWLTMLDFDPDVSVLATQILQLHGRDSGGSWRHVPDVWLRRADGSVQVVDVKNPRHLDHEEVQQQAARTEAACRRLGWRYTLVGAPPRQRWANIVWLAGYRRPLRAGHAVAQSLLKAAQEPIPFAELATAVPTPPELARPVIFHLLWTGQLVCDLTAPLRASTLLTCSASIQ